PLRESTACNSTLEALARGVPVVTSSTGMESDVDDNCGRVCSVGDAEGMARTIEESVDSPDRVKAAREGARKRALEMDWPIVARRIARHLDFLWMNKVELMRNGNTSGTTSTV